MGSKKNINIHGEFEQQSGIQANDVINWMRSITDSSTLCRNICMCTNELTICTFKQYKM